MNQTVHAIVLGQKQIRHTCNVCSGTGNISVPNFGMTNCPNCYGRCYIETSEPEKWYIPNDSYYHFKVRKIGVDARRDCLFPIQVFVK